MHVVQNLFKSSNTSPNDHVDFKGKKSMTLVSAFERNYILHVFSYRLSEEDRYKADKLRFAFTCLSGDLCTIQPFNFTNNAFKQRVIPHFTWKYALADEALEL